MPRPRPTAGKECCGMRRLSLTCINNVRTSASLQGTAWVRQCIRITAVTASHTVDQSDTSTWSSPGNYSQCQWPHKTVSRLNSEWSHFLSFPPNQVVTASVCCASQPTSGVDGILATEERLPIGSWNNPRSLRWEARVAHTSQSPGHVRVGMDGCATCSRCETRVNWELGDSLAQR